MPSDLKGLIHRVYDLAFIKNILLEISSHFKRLKKSQSVANLAPIERSNAEGAQAPKIVAYFSAGAQASLSAKKASVRSPAWVAATALYEPR